MKWKCLSPYPALTWSFCWMSRSPLPACSFFLSFSRNNGNIILWHCDVTLHPFQPVTHDAAYSAANIPHDSFYGRWASICMHLPTVLCFMSYVHGHTHISIPTYLLYLPACLPVPTYSTILHVPACSLDYLHTYPYLPTVQSWPRCMYGTLCLLLTILEIFAPSPLMHCWMSVQQVLSILTTLYSVKVKFGLSKVFIFAKGIAICKSVPHNFGQDCICAY